MPRPSIPESCYFELSEPAKSGCLRDSSLGERGLQSQRPERDEERYLRQTQRGRTSGERRAGERDYR